MPPLLSLPARILQRLRARGLWVRRLRLATLTVAIAYVFLLAFPGVLFAHHVDHGPFHVWSDRPLDPALAAVLDDASARLARSPLNDPSMSHRLYICNNSSLRRLLTPLTAGAFGSTYLLRHNTVLNRVDIPANLIFRDAPSHNRRPLSAVIAHERTHALLVERYGALTGFRLPRWKVEGYCEYVGGDPSFDFEEGQRLLREGREDDSGPFRYLKAYLMMKHLLDVERLSPDEVFARRFDERELLEKVRASLRAATPR